MIHCVFHHPILFSLILSALYAYFTQVLLFRRRIFFQRPDVSDFLLTLKSQMILQTNTQINDTYKQTLLAIIAHDNSKYPIQSMLDQYLPIKKDLHAATNNTINDVIFISDSVSEAATKAGYKTLLPDPYIYQSALRTRRRWKYRGIIVSKDVPKTVKMLAAFEYFLYNTSLPWLKYQDGDAYIFFDNYIRMMDDYTAAYPFPAAFTTPIVKGACTVDPMPKEYYIQGGTGLLFSRKAVEKLMENWKEYIYSFNTFEDRAIMELITKMGVSLVNLSSTYFIGDPIVQTFKKNLDSGNFQDLPKCPEHPITQCAREFYYLNKVASIHRIDDYKLRIDKLIQSGAISDHIRFYHNSWCPKLCYMD